MTISKYILNISLNKDVPLDWQLSFQDSASPIMEEVTFLHDQVMFIAPVISVLIFWLILRSVLSKYKYKFLVEGTLIEIVWTIIPAIILVFIAFPSLKLLYLMDETMEPTLTIKAVGHQWYWSYEYSDYDVSDLEYDSYMIPTSDIEEGDNRLLEVDNQLVLPIQTHVRILVTGADVIHSFALPSLGVKLDAVPGRLNQTNVFIKRSGLFYGQCSEICGSNHSFMPIAVRGVSLNGFIDWIETKISEE
ncbi:cytochrome c oxidase subunit II (mitochondrion) [Rhopilema esculentum]|uniref:Cytochrome c oxidase subunit 2 n=1 Tax=Rhopilema esculentum TaxID=499914 RepID=A0A222YW26_9CNID|nr:cytochrome c oxidase subunit II [Rhopilema esculentum]ASR75167.1 cytochrome c oxidase subunit II [Rhopilema esculentum]